MNIHEYQAKEILARYGVTIQRGKVASTVDEAVAAAHAIQKETGSRMVCDQSTNPCRRQRERQHQ